MSRGAARDRDPLLLTASARAVRDAAVRRREDVLGVGAAALFLLLATSGLVAADRAFALALVAYAAARIACGAARWRRLQRDPRAGWAREARIASARVLASARGLDVNLRARLDRLAMLAAVLADRLEDRTTSALSLARALTTDLPILARAAELAASRRHDPGAQAELGRAVEHVEKALDEAMRAWDAEARDELQALLAILARRAAERGLG